ncbi:MAG: flagellar motor protein MotB [Bacteroidetes bacterium HGW-Bacteroidetes-21]|nr:MAG: flagellar motor protein MotB [Bacteroidetes bacterium HGW-Bacteroidetes-21]
MKNVVLLSLAIVTAFSSCKPIYRCGDAKPEKKLIVTKRIKNVIQERDLLCNTVSVRDNQITKMEEQIVGLNEKISKAEKQYSDLISENLSQAEQYSISLKQKSEELIAKEKLLQDREKALNDLQQIISRQDSVTKRLNDILRKALLGFQSDELSVEIKNGKVYVSMSDKLLFKSGSASIEAKGKEAIKVLADVLDKNSDIDILVEGHTDNIPIKTSIYHDNWDLSVSRATSIVRILTEEYKIAPVRLTASGKGEYSPKSLNSTPEGRANNRRTEIILTPKLDEIMKLINY